MIKMVLFLMTALFLPMAVSANDAVAKSDTNGIFIYENPANFKAEFDIITPEPSVISVLVYDAHGNVMFSKRADTQAAGNSNALKVSWNLENRAGRRVAAGAYTIQATARSTNGNGIYQYFTQLGVRR